MKKLNQVLLTLLLVLALAGVAYATVGQKTATLDYTDIKISLNGTEIVPQDANGNAVEPFAIEGTTYLPVRAVADALGLEVGWDQATKTVVLTGGATTAMPVAPFSLKAGQYIVGEDIPAGKYDCSAVSGSGNFHGTVASLGFMGLNEILGAPGTAFEDTQTYSNLRLQNGDVIVVGGDLEVQFTGK